MMRVLPTPSVRRLVSPFVFLLLATVAHAVPMTDGFDYPVGKPNASGYYVAQDFGENAHLGEDWNGTGGGDTDLGDPVYAASNGEVAVSANFGGPNGWGNVIMLRHDTPDGIRVTMYAHLNSRGVTGGTVTRGQQIGTIGKTGGPWGSFNSAHLHFELRLSNNTANGNGYGSPNQGQTDPSNYINGHRPPWGATGPWEGHLDQPASGSETDGWDVKVKGWVWHKGGQPPVAKVWVFIEGVYDGEAAHSLYRDDLGAYIGFEYNWDARKWADHTVTVQALAIDSQGGRTDGYEPLLATNVHVEKDVVFPPTSVQVSPTRPRDADDLVAAATGGWCLCGVAILGYEYEWSPDGGATWGNGGAVLPNGLTVPGQQWLARARTLSHFDRHSEAWTVSTPVTVDPRRRPDVLARRQATDPFVGGNVYEDVPVAQVVSCARPVGQEARYYLRLENDGNLEDRLRLKGPGGGAAWGVKYYRGWSGGADITASVVGKGWLTPVLASGAGAQVLVVVTPKTAGAEGNNKTVIATVNSLGNAKRKDSVKLVTRCKGGAADAVATAAVVVTGLSAAPTRMGVEVTFGLSAAADVEARVLNLAGRPVRRLCEGRECEAGVNVLLWNGQSDEGLRVPGGTYLVRVTARGEGGEESAGVAVVNVR